MMIGGAGAFRPIISSGRQVGYAQRSRSSDEFAKYQVGFMKHPKMIRWATIYLRWSLGLTFLSACADRFGLWGPHGSRYAVWGDWSHFAAYAATLNSFLPAWLRTPTAYIATVAEISFGLALIAGFFLKEAAYGSAVLLALFAFGMTLSLGIKAPLNYSVFVDAGAAWLLACLLDQTYVFTSKSQTNSQAAQTM